MSDPESAELEITPELLLKAYACGVFPMADSADDPDLFWVEPNRRGVLPLDHFHIPKSLKKTLRKTSMRATIDTDFEGTLAGCAERVRDQKNTWINQKIRDLYTDLHRMGHAHSFEVRDDGELVGGLYGVRLGRAFFGESMFSLKTDASKIALVHLVYHMRINGFVLLDTQFRTDHLERFGVIEITKQEYQELLAEALMGEAFFDLSHNQAGGAMSDSILQSFNHIS